MLLIGPPGSGKGTQGQRLASERGLQHIAAGDVLRKEVADASPIGLQVSGYLERGELVPHEVIIELLMPLIRAAVEQGGYVLDGFPRTVEQANLVRHIVDREGSAADVAFYLEAPRDELVARLLARATIEGRSDDTAEVVANRLQIFDEDTHPLVEYYRDRGMLHVIDATKSPEEVSAAIHAVLDELDAC